MQTHSVLIPEMCRLNNNKQMLYTKFEINYTNVDVCRRSPDPFPYNYLQQDVAYAGRGHPNHDVCYILIKQSL
jgi:hypothetical protein